MAGNTKKRGLNPEYYSIFMITIIVLLIFVMAGLILKNHITRNNDIRKYVYSYINNLENESFDVTKSKNEIMATKDGFDSNLNTILQYNKEEDNLLLKVPYNFNFNIENYDSIKNLLKNYRKKSPFDFQRINSAVNKMTSDDKKSSDFIDLDGKTQGIEVEKGYIVIKLNLNC